MFKKASINKTTLPRGSIKLLINNALFNTYCVLLISFFFHCKVKKLDKGRRKQFSFKWSDH